MRFARNTFFYIVYRPSCLVKERIALLIYFSSCLKNFKRKLWKTLSFAKPITPALRILRLASHWSEGSPVHRVTGLTVVVADVGTVLKREDENKTPCINSVLVRDLKVSFNLRRYSVPNTNPNPET